MFTAVLLGVVALPLAGASQMQESVTYSEHVAALIQENCQVCHQPGGIGPMSFMSYDEVRPWAPVIKERVATSEMPPYHYDREVGIQALQYDMRLSEEEIATFVAWVDQGAPEGDPSLLPPPATLRDPAQWQLAAQFGEPDLIVPSEPFTVPASGQDLWWEPLVKIPLETPRYIKAIEVKPSVAGRMVAHHANTSLYVMAEGGQLERGGGSRFTEYAAGKLGEIVPEGAGRLIPLNSYVRWSIHYFPYGEVLENDQVELAFWLHPEGYEPEYTQTLNQYGLDGDLLIPPHGTAMLQGFHSWDHPVRIDSFQPHGHLRLRGSSLEIYHPSTGEREVASVISNWNAWWHHSHLYEPDAAPLIPAGSVMILTHWYDNTEGNVNNPDPDQWVYGGSRTGDEMSHDWISVSHLSQEQYEQIVADREAKKAAAEMESGG
jgi:mono/diheme cytochrome c family protein